MGLFRVESESDDGWDAAAQAVEAESHHQAVVRGGEDAGLYRVRRHGEEDYVYFVVPEWGPPTALPAI